ncbi:unnamed protein product [Penicillium manginii]
MSITNYAAARPLISYGNARNTIPVTTNSTAEIQIGMLVSTPTYAAIIGAINPTISSTADWSWE